MITVRDQEHECELKRARVMHPEQKVRIAEASALSAIARILAKVYEIRISKLARKCWRAVIGHHTTHVKAAAQPNEIGASLHQRALCHQHWRIECLGSH
jgi:hypothetical protein